MSQTNNEKQQRTEDEALLLLEIAKAIDEVKDEGFGEVRVYVQNSKIYRWELVKSRTKKTGK